MAATKEPSLREQHAQMCARYLTQVLAHPSLSKPLKRTVRQIINNDLLVFGSASLSAKAIPTTYPKIVERLTWERRAIVFGCIRSAVEALGGLRIAEKIERASLSSN